MDTTAKVDIRKLQLLNDRISQTIEALNQVRLSVHGLGLSHSIPQQVPGLGFGGLSHSSPYVPPQFAALQAAQLQAAQIQAAQIQAAQLQAAQFQGGVPGVVPGLSHTSPYAYSQTAAGWPTTAGWPMTVQAGAPWAHHHAQAWTQSAVPGYAGGLAHTSPTMDAWGHAAYGALDPYTATRIMHSFPFAGSAVPAI